MAKYQVLQRIRTVGGVIALPGDVLQDPPGADRLVQRGLVMRVSDAVKLTVKLEIPKPTKATSEQTSDEPASDEQKSDDQTSDESKSDDQKSDATDDQASDATDDQASDAQAADEPAADEQTPDAQKSDESEPA